MRNGWWDENVEAVGEEADDDKEVEEKVEEKEEEECLTHQL